LRQAEYEKYANQPPLPERITTFGTVYHGNVLTQASSATSPDTSIETNADTLQGIGCSAGIVRGRVRVVSRPDELRSLDGDILVTSSTDPGWVALFPSASAVLVERGSLLSHSAIVSRELGIPCVVGISGLLATLKTGDWVEMNGTTGRVTIDH
jgi:pyruvate,water dikinase